MPVVECTKALSRFFPELQVENLEGESIAEILFSLDRKYPGLRAYIVDDQGALRQHVNIFIGDHMIVDRGNLSDKITSKDRIFIFQALSGG